MTEEEQERRRFPWWWVWLLILAVLALRLYMTIYPALSLRPHDQDLHWPRLW